MLKKCRTRVAEGCFNGLILLTNLAQLVLLIYMSVKFSQPIPQRIRELLDEKKLFGFIEPDELDDTFDPMDQEAPGYGGGKGLLQSDDSAELRARSRAYRARKAAIRDANI